MACIHVTAKTLLITFFPLDLSFLVSNHFSISYLLSSILSK